MKVFFNASARGIKYFSKEYKRIFNTIKNLGHTPIYDLVVTETSEDDFYGGLEKGGKKTLVDFHNKTISLIKSANINVFECSYRSSGIGYQVEKSLELNKPTIILYLDNHIPHFIFGSNDEKIIIKKYNKKNLEKVVKEAFEETKKGLDKRFNFFVSPKVLAHIKNRSREQGMSESTYVRGLIIEDMRKLNK